MKKRIALRLRRIADRIDPAFIRSIEIVDRRNEPAFVDIRTRAGQRYSGHLVA